MANIENEMKFKVEDAALLKRRMKALGFGRGSRLAERDYFYDFADAGLSRQGLLFRLRDENGNGILTIKGPCMESRFKRRLEVNHVVGEPLAARKLLRACGLVERFGKEKLRTEYRWRGALLCWDRLPFIGEYIEIEGSAKAITAMARCLGLDMKQGINDSYESLFRLYCLAHGLGSCEMSFAREKRLKKT
jgi:predicted adenylyl cyclase CyaB